jgi:hypothetical protein
LREGLGELNLAGGESSLGGGKKGGIAGGGVNSVVASDASGLLAAHVPVCSLEVQLDFFQSFVAGSNWRHSRQARS